MQWFLYLDKREVLQQEYSLPPILPSPHFRWVVKQVKQSVKCFKFQGGKGEGGLLPSGSEQWQHEVPF